MQLTYYSSFLQIFLHQSDVVGAINICKRLLVDSNLMAPECIPYFLQRSVRRTTAVWRKNSSLYYNSKELKSPVGNKLSIKQKKEKQKAKRKAQRERRKNRRGNM